MFLDCGFSFTGNVGKAVSKGGELELSGRVTDALTLSAAIGYTDAKLAKDAPSLGALDGQHVQNVPKIGYSATVEYNVPFFRDSKGTLRLDHTWQDDSFRNFDPTTVSYRRQSNSLTNLRFSVEKDEWQFAAFVNNLFDEDPVLENLRQSATVRAYSTLRPRTVGISAAYLFN